MRVLDFRDRPYNGFGFYFIDCDTEKGLSGINNALIRLNTSFLLPMMRLIVLWHSNYVMETFKTIRQRDHLYV